jgi:LPS-assembly lipoprotein
LHDGVTKRGQIAFDTPKDRVSFDLRNALEDRLGTAQSPLFRLSFVTDLREDGVGITTDQITTRFNVIGKTQYTLKRLSDDSIVTTGTVDSFTSYAATGTTVATQTAQLDAQRRLAMILADQMTKRLIFSLS